MKTNAKLVFCLLLIIVGGTLSRQPAMAADSPAEPLINLTVKNEPLGEVLDTITAETGYRFKLNSQWESHLVSATIGNLPLERGLKRLLRSLNHTIIWEADRTITIMVYGKAAPVSAGGTISHAAPPQDIPETPPAVAENADTGDEDATAADAPAADEGATPDQGAATPDDAAAGADRPPTPPSPSGPGGDDRDAPPGE